MKKFTKVIAVILAAAFMVGCFAGCSSSSNDSKTLKIGFDQDGFEPFGYTDENGNWTGFDIDFAKACVDIMDDYDDVKLVPISWDNKDAELEAGNVDLIWNGFTINGRENDYEWSAPYMENSQVVVVPDSSDIKTLADLKDKTVGTQKDSSGLAAINDNAELLASIKNGEPMQFDGYETALMELKSGAVDALAMDEQVISVKIANGDADGYRILDEKLSTEQYGVGAKKGNTELIGKLNTAMETLAKDGKVAEISNKYFGYDATIWAK